MAILGIHHVSCLCADAQANLDFYVGTLGLRLVKRTVNFDAPDSYHLYYGDGRGTPGTLLTFFPVAGLAQGRSGAGAASRVDLAARPDSVAFWAGRLDGRMVDGAFEFEDPDGLSLRIVPMERPPLAAAWSGLRVPPEHALGAIDRVRLETAAFDATRATLELLGLLPDGRRRGDGDVRCGGRRAGEDAGGSAGFGSEGHGRRRGRSTTSRFGWRTTRGRRRGVLF